MTDAWKCNGGCGECFDDKTKRWVIIVLEQVVLEQPTTKMDPWKPTRMDLCESCFRKTSGKGISGVVEKLSDKQHRQREVG